MKVLGIEKTICMNNFINITHIIIRSRRDRRRLLCLTTLQSKGTTSLVVCLLYSLHNFIQKTFSSSKQFLVLSFATDASCFKCMCNVYIFWKKKSLIMYFFLLYQQTDLNNENIDIPTKKRELVNDIVAIINRFCLIFPKSFSC